MTNEALRHAMEACFSGVTFAPARREAVLRRIERQQGEQAARPQRAFSLAIAVTLALALTGGAIAAGLGVFGRMAATDEGYEDILQVLEENGERIDAEWTPAPALTAEPADAPQTDLDRMAAMHERLLEGDYSVTVNQVYCDAARLSYSFTVKQSGALWLEGEGVPTGVDMDRSFDPENQHIDDWFWYAGKTCLEEARANRDDPVAQRVAETLGGRTNAWVALSGVQIGDGCDLADGTYLTPIEGSQRVLSPTESIGYYTVRLPEGYQNGDEITFELPLIAVTRLIYQDETGYGWKYIGYDCQSVPVTVTVGGTLTGLSGEVTAEDYTASASVTLSQVELTGEVRISGGSPVRSYALVADGQELPNQDGSLRAAPDGSLVIGVRFTVPDSGAALYLRPLYSGGVERSGEEILLVPNEQGDD